MTLAYVPALKSKKGELSALETLKDDEKKQIIPLFEIPGIDWDYVNDEPAKTPKKHLESVVAMIARHWTSPFFIDFSTNLQIVAAEKGVDLLALFDEISQENSLSYIPTIDFERVSTEEYRETCKAIHERTNCGVCLRIKYSDLEDVVEESKFDEFLSLLGLTPQEVDLILDFGSISSYESDKTLYLATRLVMASVPHLNEWRNLIILSSSFPFTLSHVKRSSTRHLPRIEWLSWLRLYAKKDKIVRLPTYGDYSISHPDIVEIDPRVMSMSAAIRYSASTEWIILKGQSIKIAGFAQFPELSRQLITLPEYSGENFSAGDKNIFDYATGTNQHTGNATTWRQIGNNHHFTLVLDQISSLV